MPRGSEYPGSPERLDAFRALVDQHGEPEVKGAKNPYTSRNGWMTSFLDPDGVICVRLDAAQRADALTAGCSEVQQYGRNMPDFVGLPADLPPDDQSSWFARSWDHAGTLEPK